MTEAEVVAGLAKVLDSRRVLAGAAVSKAYDCDAYTVDRSKPTCVVLPTTTQEVADVVRWCNENSTPFTARGAGTGLSGGSLPALGGVVISTKKMTHILEIDIKNRCLLAQAGIANKRISDAVRQHGLHFAPDPSSQSVSTLGGNIAENSGGPHTLKYGVTAQHVTGLTMVEPGGRVVKLGSKSGDQAGYDFVGLIVGGEGTLGVVTEAWVKLTPLPQAVATALIAFPSVKAATLSVAQIIASGTVPAALEMMDARILFALEKAFGLQSPAGTEAMLLVECDGATPEEIAPQLESVAKVCRRNAALEIKIAADDAERERMWFVRKKGIGAMGRLAPSIVTHDGVIPRSKLPEMLEYVYAVAAQHKIGVANIFHAGDGNLHPCFYFDDRDPAQVEAVVLAGEEIIMRCLELGGSVTGEHGIGVEKADLLGKMFTSDDLRLQAMAKQIFNDGSLCNPCKVLPNQKGCIEHKARWRGIAT